jgi:anthranilate/para-aminobenzoate synthase component I
VQRKVVNRPLAGTRRRGATEIEDQALEDELLADEKERAEHVMLVDLGRNDVGKVRNSCKMQREILGVSRFLSCDDLGDGRRVEHFD